MPGFYPFRALRPVKDKVARFTAKTSDFRNIDEVYEDMKSFPESYYYVTKQSLILKELMSVEEYFCIGSEFVYQKTEEGVLFRENQPNYYLYKQVDHKAGRSFLGIIGLVDVEDLKKGKIKKHELTKVVREEYLYKQLHYTEVLGEPVLMGFKSNETINSVYEQTMKQTPEYDFMSPDEKEHVIWLINDSQTLEMLQHEFDKTDAFYIADGHHRSASAERNYERNPDPSNRYYMVYLLDEEQFHIETFHRLISEIDDEFDEMLGKLSIYFNIAYHEAGHLYIPQKHAEFGILTRYFSYKLTLLDEGDSANPEQHLDVTLLEDYFLKPVLNIHNPRTDHRLQYMAAKEDISPVLRSLQNREIDMIVSNFPVSFKDVRKIADANKTMPPKSTYIEPKLRGGLIMQKFIK
ncbi:MAG: DUF1015 domain-containing protein [Flavobacteriales bacterium]|nr:DUF1015 domain-containing protein [Flavobacteriales bacterium]